MSVINTANSDDERIMYNILTSAVV